MERFSVSFIVPALNEEAGIEPTVATILEAVSGRDPSSYEIILVNDGSTDGTGQAMERLSSRHDRVRVVQNPRNLGQGGSYKQGAAAARCDYLMLVAGDNAATASSITATIAHLGEADILLPYLENPEVRPWVRRIGSRAFTAVINTMFGLKIPYYLGAVPRRDLLNKITITTSGYGFGAEIVVKLIRAGHSYVAVGIRHAPAPGNRSSALRPGNLVKVFRAIVNMRREICSKKQG